MKRRVLVASNWFSRYCSQAKTLLVEQGCEIRENETDRVLSFDELRPLVPDLDGVIAGLEIWNRELLEQAGNLKIIARWGAGYDNIDVDRRAGIGHQGHECPGSPLQLGGGVHRGCDDIRPAHRPAEECPDASGSVETGDKPGDFGGKTVGLVGFGSIGRLVAEKLRGFGVKLLRLRSATRIGSREASGRRPPALRGSADRL